jgi:hypothetical protein
MTNQTSQPEWLDLKALQRRLLAHKHIFSGKLRNLFPLSLPQALSEGNSDGFLGNYQFRRRER